MLAMGAMFPMRAMFGMVPMLRVGAMIGIMAAMLRVGAMIGMMAAMLRVGAMIAMLATGMMVAMGADASLVKLDAAVAHRARTGRIIAARLAGARLRALLRRGGTDQAQPGDRGKQEKLLHDRPPFTQLH